MAVGVETVSEAAVDDAIKASGGVGFWTWNIKDDIAQADTVSALLFNLTPARSREGVTLSVLMGAIHPEDLDKLSSTILQRVRTGGSYSMEYRVVSPAGKTRWLFTRAHFFLDAAGVPNRGRGVIVDITDAREDAEAWIDSHSEFADEPIGRAADHCLSAHHELSKTGNTKLLMSMEMLLMDLARMIADQQLVRAKRVH
jgi:hypothetical protein